MSHRGFTLVCALKSYTNCGHSRSPIWAFFLGLRNHLIRQNVLTNREVTGHTAQLPRVNRASVVGNDAQRMKRTLVQLALTESVDTVVYGYEPGLEKLKNPNRSSIFSPQKRKLPNRFSVISVTVVCFHSVLFFSFKIQGASSLLAQRLTYQYCFNTCSININIGISIINSNFAPTVQTRHISSTFIFPISGSLSY